MAADMRAALKAVAALFPTAIISGRGLHKVTAFVQLDELYYAGSHGLDIAGPRAQSGAAPLLHQPVPWAELLMDRVHDALVAAVAAIAGASVEHNKFCVTVHYRQCPDAWREVEAAVGTALAGLAVGGEAHELHVTRGRKVFEVRPRVDWDKGKALLFLLQELGLLGREGAPPLACDVFTIYLGDDVSDEDAFQTLADRGLGAGVLVASRCKPTAARFTLQSPSEVLDFLTRLRDLGLRRAATAAQELTPAA